MKTTTDNHKNIDEITALIMTTIHNKMSLNMQLHTLSTRNTTFVWCTSHSLNMLFFWVQEHR
jgi:hypothetical protein